MVHNILWSHCKSDALFRYNHQLDIFPDMARPPRASNRSSLSHTISQCWQYLATKKRGPIASGEPTSAEFSDVFCLCLRYHVCICVETNVHSLQTQKGGNGPRKSEYRQQLILNGHLYFIPGIPKCSINPKGLLLTNSAMGIPSKGVRSKDPRSPHRCCWKCCSRCCSIVSKVSK